MTEESRGPPSFANRLWRGLWLWLVVGVFVVPNLEAGQTIDSNRPGVSFSPKVVGLGHWQLDNGLKMPFSWGDARSGFVEREANLPKDGGYQWLIDDRMQFDFNAGLGLNDRTGDYRLEVGLSIRL